MNPLELIHTAIRGLSILLNNPAFGGGSNLRFQEAAELLGMLDQILMRGEDAYEDLVELAETIQGMVDSNRAPTPAEWAALRARSDAAHAVLQDAKEDLEPTTETKLEDLTDDQLREVASDMELPFSEETTRDQLLTSIQLALDNSEE